jgi:catechol 2,3-dioxygenase-like lactoylglutathione lyase family enzyme
LLVQNLGPTELIVSVAVAVTAGSTRSCTARDGSPYSAPVADHGWPWQNHKWKDAAPYPARIADPRQLPAPLVPELDVDNLHASLEFYVGLIGFTVVFQRRREHFAYLALERAELMLQDANGPGRRFRTATLERPFGRGINLQIAVPRVDQLYKTMLAAGVEPVIPIEERWYDIDVITPSGRWMTSGPTRAGNRQFVVADPDGYLLRFFTSLRGGVGITHRT